MNRLLQSFGIVMVALALAEGSLAKTAPAITTNRPIRMSAFHLFFNFWLSPV